MNKTLPFTPRVQPGEAPVGVLRRGAFGNIHHSSVRFAFSLNAKVDHSISSIGTMARNPALLRPTFEAMGLPISEIDQIAYMRSGQAREDDVHWNGLRVPVGDLQFRRSRICVACYVESGYERSEWDHVAAVACPRHRVLLNDECPCCGALWTPAHDPLSCGCPPEAMISRQTPCSQDVGSMLQHIIESSDQKGLLILGRLWKVMRYWTYLGVKATRAYVADTLAAMIGGRWPAAPAPSEGAMPLHPRVAIAPLLASKMPGCRDQARILLRTVSSALSASNLNQVWWPATKAMAVLGIGRQSFDRLVDAGHVVVREDGLHSASSINDLLLRVQGTPDGPRPMYDLRVLRSAKHRESLESLVTKIATRRITIYYCPAEEGLSGLRCSAQNPPPSAVPHGFGVDEVAYRLGTNGESIRRLIKLKLLSAAKGCARSAVEWRIEEQSFIQFEQTYVFASAVARDNGCAVTTISSRLRSAGLIPVSGPEIDGGVTFIFRRADLARIDLKAALTGAYDSLAGRKKKGSRPERPGIWTCQETARHLEISVRQLREVVRANWITPCAVVVRRRMFDQVAVNALKRALDKDYVSVSNAAAAFGQSIGAFRRTWIDTQMVRAHRFAEQVLVDSKDLDGIRDLWQNYGTSSSIGRTLSRTRSLCPNLEKIGKMPAPEVLGHGARKVRLYARSAPHLDHYLTT